MMKINSSSVGKKIKISPEGMLRYNFRDYGIDPNQNLYIKKYNKKIPAHASTLTIQNDPDINRVGVNTLSIRIDDAILNSNTIKEFENEIEILQNELQNIQEKIDFMKENNLEEFDEEEYKLSTILQTFKEKELSDNQKIKKIKEFLEKNN